MNQDRVKLKLRYLRAKESLLRRTGMYSVAKARYWARVAWDKVRRETNR